MLNESKMNAAGAEKRDIPLDVQAKGEVGVGHWRRAMEGYVVTSTYHAELICKTVLTDLGLENDKVVVSFRAAKTRLRGNYRGGHINLFGHSRLATLLHELAHHVTNARFGWAAKSHGKEFKSTFVKVFRSFGTCYGLDTAGAAQEAQITIEDEVDKIKIGDRVKMTHHAREFIVTGFGRTRIKMKCAKTGTGDYSANPVHMVIVESKADPLKVKEVDRRIADAVKAAARKAAPKFVIAPSKAVPISELGIFTAPDPKPVVIAKPTPKPSTIRAAKVDSGAVNRGDRVANTRKAGSFWTVLEVMMDGKLRCKALTDDSRPGKKLPIGRTHVFAARTMKLA